MQEQLADDEQTVDPKLERTKPANVARAELDAYVRGIDALTDVINYILGVRKELLDGGWPPGHGLCIELDQTAAHYTSLKDRTQIAMTQHMEHNKLSMPSRAVDASVISESEKRAAGEAWDRP